MARPALRLPSESRQWSPPREKENPMETSNQNPCRCDEISCGCQAAGSERNSCACENSCACDAGCSCNGACACACGCSPAKA